MSGESIYLKKGLSEDRHDEENRPVCLSSRKVDAFEDVLFLQDRYAYLIIFQVLLINYIVFLLLQLHVRCFVTYRWSAYQGLRTGVLP